MSTISTRAGLAEAPADEVDEALVVQRLAAAGDRRRVGLEAGLADHAADRLVRVQGALAEQPPERGQRADAGRPGVETLRPGEQPLGLEDRGVLDLGRQPLRLTEDPQDPLALGGRVAAGEPLG